MTAASADFVVFVVFALTSVSILLHMRKCRKNATVMHEIAAIGPVSARPDVRKGGSGFGWCGDGHTDSLPFSSYGNSPKRRAR